MPRIALITGITGQDGSFLAEFLRSKGYQVHGIVRVGSPPARQPCSKTFTIHPIDLLDAAAVERTVRDVRPHEFYHLAATSFVPQSWQQPLYACDVTGLSTVRCLEAIRRVDTSIRFYQAGSSEMFGQVQHSPQNEQTEFKPRNPYAVAKVFAHQMLRNYRDRYDMFACTGILYNHESARRNIQFVTRKITNTAAKIKLGLAHELRLGNLDAARDWGFAGDYVKSMWLMLQQDAPRDFVIGSGIATPVREFAKIAFESLGLDYRKYVSVDPEFFRPVEAIQLVADPTQANEQLGWRAKTTVKELVEMMARHDLQNLVSHQGPGLNEAA